MGDVTGPDQPEVLWQGTTFNTLFGCQIYIWNGYLATMRFQTANVSPTVVYDLETGQELWSLDLTGPNSRTMPVGFRDGTLYLVNYQENGDGDTLYAYDPATGAMLWKADALVRFSIAHMASFTTGGDLVLPSNTHVHRIDRATGATVWSTPRNIPNTGAEYLCVTEDRVYGFEGFINTDKKLVAYDLATGLKLYETEGLPGHGDQEVPLMADGQGRVFVIRDGTGEVRAYEDTGTGFTLLWTAATAIAADGVGSTANFGTGPDGTLYFVGESGNTLVRLDPNTGTVQNESPVLAENMDPRITVATDGTLFVTDGIAAGGRLHALSPDLEVLWQEPFPFNYYSGPALGYPGYLAMTGNGTNLVVYRTQGAGTGPGTPSGTIAVYPNPASTVVHVQGIVAGTNLRVLDTAGRTVLTATGSGGVTLDVGGLPAGVYTVVAEHAGETASRRVVVVR
jgi:outer membrane protein assembly factor BamB